MLSIPVIVKETYGTNLKRINFPFEPSSDKNLMGFVIERHFENVDAEKG